MAAVFLASQPNLPAQQATPPPAGRNPSKLELKEPWGTTTIRFVIPATAQSPGGMELLEARRACYAEVVQPSYTNSYWIVAAEDPHARRTFVIQWSYDGVYVSLPSGVRLFGVDSWTNLYWLDSYVEIDGVSGKLSEAIRLFETGWDAQDVQNNRRKMSPFEVYLDADGKPGMKRTSDPNLIPLAPAAPWSFNKPKPDFHGHVWINMIESAALKDGVLRVDIRTLRTASFWVDLNRRKVLRCVVKGEELYPTADRWLPDRPDTLSPRQPD